MARYRRHHRRALAIHPPRQSRLPDLSLARYLRARFCPTEDALHPRFPANPSQALRRPQAPAQRRAKRQRRPAGRNRDVLPHQARHRQLRRAPKQNSQPHRSHFLHHRLHFHAENWSPPPQLTSRRQRIRKTTHWPWGNPIDAHAHRRLLPQPRSWVPTKAATMRRCQEPTAPSCASSRPRSCRRAIPMPTLRQSTDADRRPVQRTASPLCPRWPTQAREFAMTWQPKRHGRARKHNRRVSWFDRL